MPHCNVKIKDDKPFTYSTLVSVWVEYGIFQLYISLSLWINCRSPENIQNFRRLKKMYFLPSRREIDPSLQNIGLLERRKEQSYYLSRKKY